MYNQAFTWWDSIARGDSPLVTDEELILLTDPIEGAPTPAVRAALAKVQPYVDSMRAGAGINACDFSLDRSQGYMIRLPHLAKFRTAARFLKLEAQVRMHDGDIDGATESLRAVAGFSGHARGDSTILSSLVSAAMLGLQDRTVEDLLNTGSLGAAHADLLAQSLEPMRGADPFGLAAAVRGESDSARTSFEQAIVGGEVDPREIASMFSMLGVRNPGVHFDPEQLRAQLDRMDTLCDEYASAVENPDRDAARKAISELNARIESGAEGEIATLLMPGVGRAAESAWRMSDDIEARYRMLDDIRTGKVSAAHYANAALAYVRAARLVEGMPLDRQREIAVGRVAAGVLAPEGKSSARRAIDPYRAPLRACFQEAAQRSRCDLAVLYRKGVRKPSLYPGYVLDLRGAVRLLLADALLGTEPSVADGSSLRGNEPLFTAEEAIAAALRCAIHVASDPTVGHSFAAGSMLREIGGAIEDAKRRTLLDAEAVARLALIATRLDREGPLRFKDAVARDRKLLFEYFGCRGPDIAAGHPLEQRDVHAVATYVFVTQLLIERSKDPEAFQEQVDPAAKRPSGADG